jgi:hypothetical protein
VRSRDQTGTRAPGRARARVRARAGTRSRAGAQAATPADPDVLAAARRDLDVLARGYVAAWARADAKLRQLLDQVAAAQSAGMSTAEAHAVLLLAGVDLESITL